jgi:hypothetical protein
MDVLKKDDVALKYEDTDTDLPRWFLSMAAVAIIAHLRPRQSSSVTRTASFRSIFVDTAKATPRIRTTQWLLLETILCGFVQSCVNEAGNSGT